MACRALARGVAIAAFGAIAIAAVGLAVLPPKYKGTTVILIDPRQPRVTNSEAVLSGMDPTQPPLKAKVELIDPPSWRRKSESEAANLAAGPEFNSPSALD